MDDIKESNLRAPSHHSFFMDQEGSNSRGGEDNDAVSSNKEEEDRNESNNNLNAFFAQIQQQIDGTDPVKAAEDERLTLELIEKIQKEEEEAL